MYAGDLALHVKTYHDGEHLLSQYHGFQLFLSLSIRVAQCF